MQVHHLIYSKFDYFLGKFVANYICFVIFFFSSVSYGSTSEIENLISIESCQTNTEFKGIASNFLRKHIHQNPKDIQAKLKLGIVLLCEQNESEAMLIFQNLIDNYPEIPESYNNLAVLYANQGEINKAIFLLKRATIVHPQYKVAKNNLNKIYEYLNKKSLSQKQ